MRSGAQPTRRGVAVTGTLLVLLVVAVATGTPALVPILVAAGLPVLVAPLIAGARARTAEQELVVTAQVESAVVPVGATSRLGLSTEVRRGGSRRRRWPPLGLAADSGWWQRAADLAELPLGRPTARLLGPRRLVDLRVGGTVRIRVPTIRRGVYVLAPAPTWHRDPLGLFVAPGPPLSPVTLAVHPVPRRDAAIRSTYAASPDTDPLGELLGVRPYVPGDRLSLLHWPSRARTGTWQVKQFRPDAMSRVRVVVDDRMGVHRRADYDGLLAVVLGLVEQYLEQGSRVELLTVTGRAFAFDPLAGEVARLRHVVAGLDPRTADGVAPRLHGPILTTAAAANSLPRATGTVVVAA